MSTTQTAREVLLDVVATFTASASMVRGVTRIALIGSLTTPKVNPKDADVLVSVDSGADIAGLASLGRKAKGGAQNHNLGADIFLATTSGEYLGRTCSYRDCHPRAHCLGQHCGRGRYLCDDLQVVTLPSDLIARPPLELWPRPMVRGDIPADTARILGVS